MSDVEVFAVPKDLLPVVWNEASEKLAPAVVQSNGRMTVQELKEDVLKGDSALWVVWQNDMPVAYYTTRVTAYPRKKAMVLEWIGGSDIESWMDATIEAMREHARLNQCDHIEFTGREGWGRLLKKTGWKPEYVCYKMELSDG